jgi:YHS domain-containing protein
MFDPAVKEACSSISLLLSLYYGRFPYLLDLPAAIPFAPQLLEITPFRLTHPFRLAYTAFTAVCGGIGKRAAWQTLIPMNFLARAIRFLFWLLVLSWGLRLLRRVVSSMFQNQQAPGPQPGESSEGTPAPTAARRLVRDPVCGMHVDETLSIPLRAGGELLHFCSPACRDEYAVNVRKFAVKG